MAQSSETHVTANVRRWSRRPWARASELENK
eukprot:CAMPEP_0194050100 /NCGR_PEP_ID=MMETSP0009_2-20130614/33071_1 /TAXON_ID=210454 /ORGANISM="Grammatophora oceanica, Strain CCMP 410" /LENGTH=30 /DNA_ID= /DNA_START= /DNA_END= /DNA_ORIENTATION=